MQGCWMDLSNEPWRLSEPVFHCFHLALDKDLSVSKMSSWNCFFFALQIASCVRRCFRVANDFRHPKHESSGSIGGRVSRHGSILQNVFNKCIGFKFLKWFYKIYRIIYCIWPMIFRFYIDSHEFKNTPNDCFLEWMSCQYEYLVDSEKAEMCQGY